MAGKKRPEIERDLFGAPLGAAGAHKAVKARRAAQNQAQQAQKAETVSASAAAGLVNIIVPVPNAPSYTYALPADLLIPACVAKAAGGNQRGAALPPGSLAQVPLGPRKAAGIITAEAPPSVAAQKLRFVEKIFDCPPLPAELLRFIRFVADYTMTPIGMVARMALAAPAALEPLPGLEALRLTARRPEKMTKARARLLALLAETPIWTRSGLAHAAGVSAAAVDGLTKLGVLERAVLPPEPAVPPPQADYAPALLTDAQARAAGALCLAAEAGEFSASLLEGVTGSGKTEIYFEAVAAVLRQNKQVLVLLPEIALTDQMLQRFAKRFGAPPAAWHSELSRPRREKIWRQTAEGQIRIIAGARSALFLPFADLGLIVVDEEHDAAYKQEERVFYNARDMAVARARQAGIPVILASATPSVETLVNVLQGRYRHVYLPSRFGAGALPKLTPLDMRANPPPKGRFLSPPLAAAVSAALAKGEQSLLFLNRRGYAPLTLCRACGHRFSCPDCSAWLVEHKSRGFAAKQNGQTPQLLCHHCGFCRPVPEACPECGALDHLTPVGPGVERIAEEAAALWPQARLLVLSADNAHSMKQMRAELDAVARGDVDIVIGTQLVAKGHHFPKMTLVGVVDADIGFGNGDLRAAERSFQLLSQVTGRAGRETGQSRGLIQTYQPQHPAIKALARGDGQGFIRGEIEERAAYHLPPFGQLAALIISAPEREDAENYARLLRRLAPEAETISLLGPAEAPLARLRGRWRFRLLVQAADRKTHIQAYLRAWLAAAPKPKSALRVQIDIDPQSFL